MAFVPHGTGCTNCYTRHIFSWPGKGLRSRSNRAPVGVRLQQHPGVAHLIQL